MKAGLTAVLTVLGLLGPVILVLVAVGTRKDIGRNGFWLRVGLAFVIWYGALVGLLYLEPLN